MSKLGNRTLCVCLANAVRKADYLMLRCSLSFKILTFGFGHYLSIPYTFNNW